MTNQEPSSGLAPGRRAQVALCVYVVWTAITLLSGVPHEDRPLIEEVDHAVGRQFVFASLFLVAVVVVLRWPGLGLNGPRPASSLRVLWLPALYIAGFLMLAVSLGLPPPGVMAILLANTLLVGFSEELMFRGILFTGLRERLSIWPAIWLTSILFGAVHMLNVFATGDMTGALIQAVAAGFSGVLFIAIRLRTGSLIVAMAVHAFWDFGLFLMGMGRSVPSGMRVSDLTLRQRLLPVLLIALLFVYALYLLRGIGRRET